MTLRLLSCEHTCYMVPGKQARLTEGSQCCLTVYAFPETNVWKFMLIPLLFPTIVQQKLQNLLRMV